MRECPTGSAGTSSSFPVDLLFYFLAKLLRLDLLIRRRGGKVRGGGWGWEGMSLADFRFLVPLDSVSGRGQMNGEITAIKIIIGDVISVGYFQFSVFNFLLFCFVLFQSFRAVSCPFPVLMALTSGLGQMTAVEKK